jgi:hypothetical protein
MFNKKTVTSKKVAANRANAKFSTGPRTERGKRAARLNAVKLGFFSEELVIPLCDGEKALEKCRALLNGIQQELQPAGIMQTWFAEKIAETLWRIRRGTRAERGSCLVNLWDAQPYQKGSPWFALVATVAAEQSKLAVLNTAWEDIQGSGKRALWCRTRQNSPLRNIDQSPVGIRHQSAGAHATSSQRGSTYRHP